MQEHSRTFMFFLGLVILADTILVRVLNFVPVAASNIGLVLSVLCFILALPVGPRSVLIGAHQFLIHPIFLALAWWKLYGFPWDPRLWVAFVVHDLGYLFQWCKTMDGEDGEKHVLFGAAVMRVFGEDWSKFSLYHSRFYAKQHGVLFSRLCVADKLAMCLEPWWLYLPRVILSGEIHEYLRLAAAQPGSKYQNEPRVGTHRPTSEVLQDPSVSWWQKARTWHQNLVVYMTAWVIAHQHAESDTWTPARES